MTDEEQQQLFRRLSEFNLERVHNLLMNYPFVTSCTHDSTYSIASFVYFLETGKIVKDIIKIYPQTILVNEYVMYHDRTIEGTTSRLDSKSLDIFERKLKVYLDRETKRFEGNVLYKTGMEAIEAEEKALFPEEFDND